MVTFQNLTIAQLKQAVQIREQISSLQAKLDTLLEGTSPTASAPMKGKRVMSAATKRKMAAAQQARYAKLKAGPAKTVTNKTVVPKIREVSTETKAKLAAAMKARWAAKRKAAQ